MINRLPIALVILRILLGPLLLLSALDGHTDAWFLVGFLTGFWSDVFDGIIARRLHISTVQLRKADSWADVGFYGCVFASAWLTHAEQIMAFRVPLLTVVVAQLALYGLSWVKFRQAPSYHTYTAKAWGITLCIAVIALFGFDDAGIALWIAIAAALVNTIEEIIMTLVLTEWRYDVPSLLHVLRSPTSPEPGQSL